MKRSKVILLAVAVLSATTMSAKNEIPLVYDQEFTGAKYPAPSFPSVDEAKVSETLPNPFEFSNSTKQVKKFKDS